MISNAAILGKADLFLGHWSNVLQVISPLTFIIQMPLQKSTLTRAQFEIQRNIVRDRQLDVQARLQDEQIARGSINLLKETLLRQMNLFTGLLDAFYTESALYNARPLAPSFRSGRDPFSRPMGDVLSLWKKVNETAAPPGVTLPLVLADGTDRDAFASTISALQFAYGAEADAEQDTDVARGERDIQNAIAYEAMKNYRETVPPKLALHPELIESLPRLTPLPGHTPKRVNVTGIFQAPNHSKVLYDPSEDPTLLRYELRGTIGDHYNAGDAILLATHGPNDPREFITDFGLGLPGAIVALKVFVILTTDNEAGSAPMIIERPLASQQVA